ncbi:restriction endonuclease subunit S [Anabaenopsis elenkinii]|uniref:Restriction endonuclease subunit S n=1 Tax=Anabaenopsis elenkinii CCIBt3563 TaxID=2779889 RepID=A0A7U3NLN5_9CYAN|nr:restriction endonuclease subunit S [Anabaenopsis elenkinii]QOV21160.1 restriction endonuclease subunit S [Anabaenopsis elenkinii CCIBt3563]
MSVFPEVELGSVCTLVNGYAFKPSDWGKSGFPIVRIQNLNNPDCGFNFFDGEIKDQFLIDSGELLFSWSGTPGTSFGAFFWYRGKAVLNQHIFRVLVDKNRVDKKYFYYAINHRLDKIIAQSHGGVGLKHITKGRLEAIKIPLPPLEEQRRIAAILDKADDIRRKRKQAIALTEELLRSTFLDMFGDPVTNPKGWKVKTLGSLCKVRRGASPRPISEYLGGSIPWIKIGDATESDDIYIYIYI